MKRPRSPRFSPGPQHRLNGRIRAREVRVIAPEGTSLGILSLQEAINLARNHGLDLVEISPNAKPPVCRIVDYGKFCYEQSKKDKESKKGQHAGKVKEVQLRPAIDPHDFATKLGHAIDFLCEDMKVKLNLRFRGREMARPELGMQVMQKFIQDLAPYGTSPETPRRAGRSVNAIVNPLPRAKRAPNPRQKEDEAVEAAPVGDSRKAGEGRVPVRSEGSDAPPPEEGGGGFRNSPFDQIGASFE
ncbi:MAG: translation initiation factor IF-3 [Verrucomicrobiales bacterium]|nr:translation initiation factor IF-3 [Verrucomicrobiales bacterium]